MQVPLIGLSLTAVLLLQAPASPNADVLAEARFLKRSELPEDVDFPLLELDFQVLQVTLHNRSSQVWTIPESIELFNRKRKSLQVVTPPEMTPKIVSSKVFRARQRAAETGPLENVPIYPNPGNYRRYPQGRAAGPAMIQVGAAQRVREVLERHQLAPGELPPGERLEGLVYVKSKKKPTELAGGRLVLGSLEVDTQ